MPEQNERIAIVETEIRGLREQHKAQSESTNIRLDAMSTALAELTAVMNKGKGAYTASLILAGVIGSAIMKAVSLVWR